MNEQITFNMKTLDRISALLGLGYTHEEIGKKLGIHRVTVSRYKKEIRRLFCEFD